MPEESICIYWKILSGSNITASISIPAALRGEGGELEWSVGYSDGTERIDSTASDTSLAVVRHETRGRAKNIGSTELFINTENLNSGDVIPGIYTGELRLDISIE